jgi:hypothetical protein
MKHYKETNWKAIPKLKKLEEWGIPHKNTRCGIIINDKIMIAKNKSRWKMLGELDWFPYYGLHNLVEALYDDALDEYAEEQQNKTHRVSHSVPIPNVWKDKDKEKEFKEFYKNRQGLFSG